MATTVYVTKWALTRGILVWATKSDVNIKPANRRWQGINAYCVPSPGEPIRTGDTLFGRDWHTTEQAAFDQARWMLARKVASLKRALAKLQALTFTNPEGKA